MHKSFFAILHAILNNTCNRITLILGKSLLSELFTYPFYFIEPVQIARGSEVVEMNNVKKKHLYNTHIILMLHNMRKITEIHF